MELKPYFVILFIPILSAVLCGILSARHELNNIIRFYHSSNWEINLNEIGRTSCIASFLFNGAIIIITVVISLSLLPPNLQSDPIFEQLFKGVLISRCNQIFNQVIIIGLLNWLLGLPIASFVGIITGAILGLFHKIPVVWRKIN